MIKFFQIWYKYWNTNNKEYEYDYVDVESYEIARAAFIAAVQRGREVEGCIVIACGDNKPDPIILAFSKDPNDDFINFPAWVD